MSDPCKMCCFDGLSVTVEEESDRLTIGNYERRRRVRAAAAAAVSASLGRNTSRVKRRRLSVIHSARPSGQASDSEQRTYRIDVRHLSLRVSSSAELLGVEQSAMMTSSSRKPTESPNFLK